jgi:hypothetical protein
MFAMQVQVCRRCSDPRWIVRFGNRLYGDYRDKEQALLDPIDAVQAGYKAQAWIKDRSTTARVV